MLQFCAAVFQVNPQAVNQLRLPVNIIHGTVKKLGVRGGHALPSNFTIPNALWKGSLRRATYIKGW